MTCIGAIKETNKEGNISITFGSDSCVSAHRLYGEHEFTKIIRKKDALIAVAGSIRFHNLINYSFELPTKDEGQDDIKYIANKFIPSLIAILKDNDCLKDRSSIIKTNSCMLLAYNSHLVKISCDFSFMEFEDYTSIGSGSDYMISALYATKDMVDSEKRLKIGLEASSLFDFYVTKPFVYETITFKNISDGQ